MIYIQLLLSYIKIGFFGFGGGYAMLSLIQNEMVTQRGWLTATEFSDIVAVSQITPGPIAINCATYVGYNVTGNVIGSLLATFAVCLPSMTVMIAATRFYLRLQDSMLMKSLMDFMRPMMVGMILAAALMLFNRETFSDIWCWIIFGLCLAGCLRRINPILLIVLSAIAGMAVYGF